MQNIFLCTNKFVLITTRIKPIYSKPNYHFIHRLKSNTSSGLSITTLFERLKNKQVLLTDNVPSFEL